MPVHAKVDQAYGYIGGEVNLTCEAVAEPAANFTWYRQHKKSVAGRIIQEPHWSILQVGLPTFNNLRTKNHLQKLCKSL